MSVAVSVISLVPRPIKTDCERRSQRTGSHKSDLWVDLMLGAGQGLRAIISETVPCSWWNQEHIASTGVHRGIVESAQLRVIGQPQSSVSRENPDYRRGIPRPPHFRMAPNFDSTV